MIGGWIAIVPLLIVPLVLIVAAAVQPFIKKYSTLTTGLQKGKMGTLLELLNKEICETAARGMFVTMLVGIYDSLKKELLLSNAGHEPPLIYSKDKKFSNFTEAGPPLGLSLIHI